MKGTYIRFSSLVAVAALLVPLLLACNVSSGQLSVPYRAQPSQPWDYCGPACVLMWRLYHRGSVVSQTEIYNYMTATHNSGVVPEAIVKGVEEYTWTGNAEHDLEACDGGPWDKRAEILTRQITSYGRDEPSIAIVSHGFHAVVVVGGQWHNGAGIIKVWDFIRVHDPKRGSYRRYTAGEWVDDWFAAGDTCEQIIASWAIVGWENNEQNYGGSVTIRGYAGHNPYDDI